MRQFNLAKTAKSVTLFCRLVKLGKPCTANAMDASGRTASLLKAVLRNGFSTKNGAPFDFPRLFICDDIQKQLYHKCTTPNDIDLSDLETIRKIQALMTYVGRKERERKERVSGREVNDDNIHSFFMEIDLSKPFVLKSNGIKDGKLCLSFTFSS